MCTKFEAGKSYKTLDGDLITVVSRKGRRVRYRDKFGKRHVATVQEHCFSERNLTACISSNLEIRD